MSALPEHPSLVLAVTQQEREAAISRLRSAYEQGAITASDLELRAGMAAMARSRRDLNTAFLGLMDVSIDDARRHAAVADGRGLAVAAHLSGWVLFLVGPLACYAAAQPGSYARREAAKAVNLSVLTLCGLAVALGVVMVNESVGAPLAALIGGCWWLTSLVAAVQASKGNDWEHPLKRWLPYEVLRESAPKP
ncbi:MAG TPA: DUF1707 and DUF4870 domain-containing protein [Propionicimonas sp.]